MSGDGHAERCACPSEGGQAGRPQARLGRDTADEKPHEATDSLQLTWHVVYHNHPSADLPEWWAYLRFVGLLFLALLFFGQAAAAFLHMSIWVVLVPFVAASIVLSVLTRRVLRRCSDTRMDHSKDGSLSLSGKGNPRLVCFGTRRELDDLKLDGQLREPFIATPMPSMRWFYAFIPVFVVMLLLIRCLEISGQAKAMLTGNCYLLMGAGFLLLPRSLYYRAAPSCLDVLRGRMWRRSLARRKRIPLDRARIFCRFDQQKLYVTQPDAADGEQDVIELRRLAEPHAFVKAVFEAAVSPHPTPPLPDDALLG
jgi:hypothetical protein